MINSIRVLRDLDRLYYGRGRNSAAHALGCLLSGKMPGAFLDRYMAGELDGELSRVRLRG